MSNTIKLKNKQPEKKESFGKRFIYHLGIFTLVTAGLFVGMLIISSIQWYVRDQKMKDEVVFSADLNTTPAVTTYDLDGMTEEEISKLKEELANESSTSESTEQEQ